jgi:Secretion system C-terminal sorting domain
VPNYALSVNEALAGLTPLNGDIIKGQSGFAQYLAGFGWLGSLQFMEAPKGYQLKISNAGTLTYPDNNSGNKMVKSTEPIVANYWNVDPTKYEYSMTMVGMLTEGGQNATLGSYELGAFAGTEARGSTQALFIDGLNAHLFFLTVFANSSGEQLQFKIYDAATGQTYNLAEKIYFTASQHLGSIGAPTPFTLQASGTHETAALLSMEVAPNPFSEATTIRFGTAQAQEVQFTVTDISGRKISNQRILAAAGLNTVRWDAANQPSGVYITRLEMAEGVVQQKVVKE